MFIVKDHCKSSQHIAFKISRNSGKSESQSIADSSIQHRAHVE